MVRRHGGGDAMRALVIDDEKNIRTMLSVFLEGRGWSVAGVADGEAALAALAREPYDLAFLDLRLRGESGLDLLPRLLGAAPGLDVVVITAYATVATAVEAVKRGAVDYLPKPFAPEQLEHVVDRIGERRATERRLAELEDRLAEHEPALETGSPRMRAVLETLARAATSDAPVLLRGESGTGKGALARSLHERSRRARGPFVWVTCPTYPEDQLAAELFGQAAAGGAHADHRLGRVEAAAGGTLFLDEVASASPAVQGRLLRLLETRTFERIGEAGARDADVRVVASTARDLEEEVAAGRFRADLLYRLDVVGVRVPALRERGDDVLALARAFLAAFARAAARRTPELSKAAEDVLLAYAWPGNVRELRNVIERATILWPSDRIEPGAFPDRLLAIAPGLPRLGGDFTLEEVEREHLLRVVGRSATLDEAARILGIDPSTLWRKRRRFEEAPKSNRAATDGPPVDIDGTPV
jgi:NtrC-family two-component system response regulator AlgB